MILARHDIWVITMARTFNFLDSSFLAFTTSRPYSVSKVNRTHVFIAGGELKDEKVSKAAYLLDWPNRVYTRVADMVYERSSHACAVVGDKIFVVGDDYR